MQVWVKTFHSLKLLAILIFVSIEKPGRIPAYPDVQPCCRYKYMTINPIWQKSIDGRFPTHS